MTKRTYDATNEKWLDNSGMKPDSVATADQWQSIPAKHTQSHKVKESIPPRLSLTEWCIVGPMAVGLGVMAAIYWP